VTAIGRQDPSLLCDASHGASAGILLTSDDGSLATNLIKCFMRLVLIGALAVTSCIGGRAYSGSAATEVSRIKTEHELGALDFSPDGMQIALDPVGYSGTDLWDWKHKRIVRHLPESGTLGSRGQVVRYSNDGTLLAMCHAGGESRVVLDVYAVATGATVYSVTDYHSGGDCSAITFAPDGKVLTRLAGGDSMREGDNILFYDTAKWEPSGGLRTIALFATRPPTAWDILPEAPRTITVPNRLQLQGGHDEVSFFPKLISYSPDGKYLAMSGQYVPLPINPQYHFAIAILDIATRAIVRTFMEEHAQDIDWNADSVRLAAAEPTAIKVLDVKSGRTLTEQRTELSESLVRYTADNKYLIEKVPKRVEIWDGEHRKLLQVISAEPECMTTSRDGRYLAIGGAEPQPVTGQFPLLSVIVHPNGVPGRAIVYALK
jgi:WD40 repeat protein